MPALAMRLHTDKMGLLRMGIYADALGSWSSPSVLDESKISIEDSTLNQARRQHQTQWRPIAQQSNTSRVTCRPSRSSLLTMFLESRLTCPSSKRCVEPHRVRLQRQYADLLASLQDVYLPSQWNPKEKGGVELYKAADKLKGKRLLVTGGDSGIGRSTAILCAMEGCEAIALTYVPDREEEDAKKTKELVQNAGCSNVTIIPSDFRGENVSSSSGCRPSLGASLTLSSLHRPSGPSSQKY